MEGTSIKAYQIRRASYNQCTESAVSSVIGVILIVFLVVALAAVMYVLIYSLMFPMEKTAYVATNAEFVHVTSGAQVISLTHLGGDSMQYEKISQNSPYEVRFIIVSSEGSSIALTNTSLLNDTTWSSGDQIYLFRTSGGYLFTDDLTKIIGAISLPSGPVGITIIDTTHHQLIATREVGMITGGFTQTPTPAPPVKAGFTYSPTQGDIPYTVQFTDHSTGPVSSYLWSFADGNTSTEKNPVHTYQKVGYHNFSLTVTNTSGGSDTRFCGGSCAKATAIAPVKAQFVAIPTIGSLPLPVQFISSSTGPVNWWLWSFGDGTTSNELHPISLSHTYYRRGTFTVSLMVRNSTGSDSSIRANYISVT